MYEKKLVKREQTIWKFHNKWIIPFQVFPDEIKFRSISGVLKGFMKYFVELGKLFGNIFHNRLVITLHSLCSNDCWTELRKNKDNTLKMIVWGSKQIKLKISNWKKLSFFVNGG